MNSTLAPVTTLQADSARAAEENRPAANALVATVSGMGILATGETASAAELRADPDWAEAAPSEQAECKEPRDRVRIRMQGLAAPVPIEDIEANPDVARLPKVARETITWLRSDEYAALMSLGGGGHMDLIAYVQKDILDLLSGFLPNRRAEVGQLSNALAAKDWTKLQYLAERMYALGNPYGFRQITTFGRFMRQACASNDSPAMARLITEYATYLSAVTVVEVNAPVPRRMLSSEPKGILFPETIDDEVTPSKRQTHRSEKRFSEAARNAK